MKLPFRKKGRELPGATGRFSPPPVPIRGAGRIPTDRVNELSSQGLSEPEIIRTLRNEGYSPIEVDRAMKGAIRTAAGAVPPAPVRPAYPPPYPEPEPEEELEEEPRRKMLFPEEARPMQRAAPPEPPFTSDILERMEKDEAELPEIPGMEEERESPEDFEEEAPLPPIRRKLDRRERGWEKRREFEEVAEGIVEEKIEEFRKEIEDVTDRFRELSSRLSRVEAEINRVQGEKKSDADDIRVRIDRYRESMGEISARMESIERAVKDSLTPMMQSMRSLSDTIKALKEEK